MGDRQKEECGSWWSCLWGTLLVLSLVMSVAALWLPLVRHHHMEIAIMNMRNRTGELEKLFDTHLMDFAQLRSQVLELEYQPPSSMKNSAQHSRPSSAPQKTELVLGNAQFESDIQMIKVEHKKFENEMERRMASLHKDLLKTKESLDASRKQAIAEVKSSWQLAKTGGQASVELAAVNSVVAQLAREVERMSTEFNQTLQSLEGGKGTADHVDHAEQGSDVTVMEMRLADLETGLSSLNASLVLVSDEITTRINTVKKVQDDSTEAGIHHEKRIQELVSIVAQQRQNDNHIQHIQDEFQQHLEASFALEAEIQKLNFMLVDSLEGRDRMEAKILSLDEIIRTQLSNTSMNEDSLRKTVMDLENLKLLLKTELEPLRNDANQEKIYHLEIMTRVDNLESLLASTEVLTNDTMEIVNSLQLWRGNVANDLNNISNMDSRLISLSEKMNLFLRLFQSFKELPHQLDSISTRIKTLEDRNFNRH